MAFITPKTNWKDGDKFNLTPDYDRIKGNIEHVNALYGINGVTLGTFTLSDVPTSSFFNNIVNNIRTLTTDGVTLRTYNAYSLVWSARELNTIEGACKWAMDNYQTDLICDDSGYCDDNTLL